MVPSAPSEIPRSGGGARRRPTVPLRPALDIVMLGPEISVNAHLIYNMEIYNRAMFFELSPLVRIDTN
jgi:hypothetical protein